MDQRERFYDNWEAMLSAGDAIRARIHTAMPGVITAWNPDNMTCDVQPAIQYQIRRGQKWVWTELPLLIMCPVHFPAGGGVTMTFPIKPGDECLIVIAERCIDAWWQNGGIQVQAEIRMQNLSDGFVIPKVWSQPNKLEAISTNSAQVRTTDGSCFIELKEGGDVNITTTQNVTVNAALNVTVIAGKDATVHAGQDLTLQADRDVKIIAGRDLGIQIGRNWNINSADDVTIASDTAVNIKAPSIREN